MSTQVLLSLGNWQVVFADHFLYTANKYHAAHAVCSDTTPLRQAAWFSHDDKPICRCCGTLVPDEIQALVLLMIAGSPGPTY